MFCRRLLFCALYALICETAYGDVPSISSTDEKVEGDGRLFDGLFDGLESAMKEAVSTGQAVMTSKVKEGSNGVTTITQTQITKTFGNRNTDNRYKRGLGGFIERLDSKLDKAKDKVKDSAESLYEKIKDRIRNKRSLGDLFDNFGDKVDRAKDKVKGSVAGVVADVINTGYEGVQKIKGKI